jgi:hypothetical protein
LCTISMVKRPMISMLEDISILVYDKAKGIQKHLAS